MYFKSKIKHKIVFLNSSNLPFPTKTIIILVSVKLCNFKEKELYFYVKMTTKLQLQNIQAYLRNHQQPQLSEKQSGYWQSAAGVLKDITNVVAVESGTVHPKLEYAGTLDLVAEYQGILSIIDWKTSRKSKSKLKECYSYPVQVVAYAGAVNFDLNYPFQVSWLILNSRTVSSDIVCTLDSFKKELNVGFKSKTIIIKILLLLLLLLLIIIIIIIIVIITFISTIKNNKTI